MKRLDQIHRSIHIPIHCLSGDKPGCHPQLPLEPQILLEAHIHMEGIQTFRGQRHILAPRLIHPHMGLLAQRHTKGAFVTYTRYVFLDAYDLDLFRESKKEKQLWKTEIISTGSSGDLRRVFPVLIAASSPYISENTGQKVKVVLKEDSKEVLEIKGINNKK